MVSPILDGERGLAGKKWAEGRPAAIDREFGVLCWMDALSEAMRATSALFFNGEFAAPWRFATPAQDKLAPIVSPDSERLVLFHLVTDGEATARTPGHDEVALTAGDIVVFPQGDAHEMWNGRTSKLFPGTRLLPKLAKGELAAEKWGGTGAVTRIICGYLGCERHAARDKVTELIPPSAFVATSTVVADGAVRQRGVLLR